GLPEGPGGGAGVRIGDPMTTWQTLAENDAGAAGRQADYNAPAGASSTLRVVEALLKTDQLWKVYRSGKVEVPALQGVDFEVFPGEFVAVMGPSGCGKSTLLHVIGGLAQATRGRVFVDGNDLVA